VGDDFLQQASTGSVQSEKWTHGSSQEREQWLLTGYRKGKPADCDTFAASR
jgi:predicted metalloprotease